MDRTNRISKSYLLNLKYHITWFSNYIHCNRPIIFHLIFTYHSKFRKNFFLPHHDLLLNRNSPFSAIVRSMQLERKKLEITRPACAIINASAITAPFRTRKGGFMGAARGQWRLHAWWRPIRISLRIQNYSNFNHSPAGQRFINIAVGTGRPFIWNAPQSD